LLWVIAVAIWGSHLNCRINVLAAVVGAFIGVMLLAYHASKMPLFNTFGFPKNLVRNTFILKI
jgi:hypothetical protein